LEEEGQEAEGLEVEGLGEEGLEEVGLEEVVEKVLKVEEMAGEEAGVGMVEGAG
jgi:hypothetical protein